MLGAPSNSMPHTSAVGRPPRSLLALLLAVLLTVANAVLPAAVPGSPLLAGLGAPVARAAVGLSISTDARYVVVPDRAVVVVAVDITVRNDTPDRVSGGAVTRYFYDGVNLGVQPEATQLAATQDGRAVTVQASARNGYQLLRIDFRQALYFADSAVIRLTYDLPAGQPRSASDVRVGKAFATFLAWSFGDTGSVRIEVPAGFTVDVTGSQIERTSSGGTTVLTATTSDPLHWYAWINASNDAGLTSERLDIAGGERIIVRAWPEDTAWRRRVADLLTRGVPQLVSRIGLPWPVDGPLSVVEVHTPLLEGYAGFFDPTADKITISEALDNLTIIHEASHAWFSDSLFTERWIIEGLADEYASRVLVALGDALQGPPDVSRRNPSAFPLDIWPPPAAIKDTQSSAREQYGYDASWFVMRKVVAAVGENGMRRVFTAAMNRTTAYVGAGAPERSMLPNDWRHFLDLTEELGGGTGVTTLVRTWALPPGSEVQLGARDAARVAYHALLRASKGWVAPYAVRQPLDAWTFDVARTRIAEGTWILARWDGVATLAARAALSPPGTLEQAYEGAADGASLDAAVVLAAQTATSLEAVVRAGSAVAVPRDWIVSLGLAGHDPDADAEAARQAWSSGDLATATTRATAALAALVAAPGVGRDRATMVGGGIVGLVLLLVMVIVLIRRRERARHSVTRASQVGGRPPSGGPTPAGAPPVATDRYATLPPSAPTAADAWLAPIEEEGADPS